MDDVSLGLAANTVGAFAFLRRKLEAIGIVINTANTVTLPPKGHAPAAEESSLLESVDVRIVGEGGVTVVGVPIGTDEYVLKRALEVVRDWGVERLVRFLANVPNKQAAALLAIETLGQRTSCLDRALDTGCPSKHAEGKPTERSERTEKSSSYQSRGGTVIFPGGVPGELSYFESSLTNPSTPFHGSGRV